jgi:hypothetical protein
MAEPEVPRESHLLFHLLLVRQGNVEVAKVARRVQRVKLIFTIFFQVCQLENAVDEVLDRWKIVCNRLVTASKCMNVKLLTTEVSICMRMFS